MSVSSDDLSEEEMIPGASGCLVALVVIGIFTSYGLGILTGAYGQLYLQKRSAKETEQTIFPEDEDAEQDADVVEETPLEAPIVVEHGGARVSLELAAARLRGGDGSGEVKLPGLLVMRLRVKNLSRDTPMEFSSWMHSNVRTWPAQLSGDRNVSYEAIYDADPRVGVYLMSLPDYRPTKTIGPGAEVVTWVAFEIAKRPVSALRLSLTAVNYGADGMLHFDIPEGAVAEGQRIE